MYVRVVGNYPVGAEGVFRTRYYCYDLSVCSLKGINAIV